jgi:predicted methyltransferase MtxX (methanogen marker protein 4)
MKLELNKEEAALVEQLVEMHVDMLEDDSHSDEDTLADLKEARALHYKLLKFFRS